MTLSILTVQHSSKDFGHDWQHLLTDLRHRPTSHITTRIATHLGIVFPLLSLSRCILGISISVNWNNFDNETLLKMSILRHILRNTEKRFGLNLVVRETDQNEGDKRQTFWEKSKGGGGWGGVGEDGVVWALKELGKKWSKWKTALFICCVRDVWFHKLMRSN